MTDPNWLLATCVQATATLVAIIGGFIASRLIALSAETNGMKNELHNISSDLQFNYDKRERLEARKLNLEVDWFVSDIIDEIVENGFDDYYYGKVQEYDLGYYIEKSNTEVDRQILEPVFNGLIRTVESAYSKIVNAFKSDSTSLGGFYEFIRTTGIEFKDREKEIYQTVYDNILKQLKRLQREEERKKSPTSTLLAVSTSSYIDNITMPRITPIGETQEHSKLVSDITLVQLDIQYLQKKEKRLNAKIKDYGRPKGIYGGLIIFVYFTLVGIIFPLALMPLDQLTLFAKGTILFFFITGLLSVFSYFIMLINKIRI